MIISLKNLANGIWWWQHEKVAWGPDLGNTEYAEIYSCREAGLTSIWWEKTVMRLGRWKALRGSKGVTGAVIRNAGLAILPQLTAVLTRVHIPVGCEPTISLVSWEEIAPLYEMAFRLKWPNRFNASPMFASKMCHFILPRVFPIVDTEATGFFDYEFYWRGMQDELKRFPEKDDALNLVRSSIGPDMHELYPLDCRVIELSHIGYTHAETIAIQRQSELA